MTIFTLYVQGFGDDEDAYEPCGTFKTREGAEARIDKILTEWEEDGGDRGEVEYIIEEHDLAD